MQGSSCIGGWHIPKKWPLALSPLNESRSNCHLGLLFQSDVLYLYSKKVPSEYIHYLGNHSILFHRKYILMQTTLDLGPPTRVHHLTLNLAISNLFIKNKSRF